MRTFSPKQNELNHDWLIIDASGKTLVEWLLRLLIVYVVSTNLSMLLIWIMVTMVVINAEKVKVTGNKGADKIYHSHTGYPGGIKSISFDKLLEKAPERTIQSAVKGMLPKNPLGVRCSGN